MIRLLTNVSANFRPKVLDEILRNLLSPQKRQGLAYQAIGTSVGGDHDEEGRAAEARQDLVSRAMYGGRRRNDPGHLVGAMTYVYTIIDCQYPYNICIYIYIRHMYIVYIDNNI